MAAWTAGLLAASPAGANGPPIHTQTAFVTGLQGAALRSFVKVTDKSAPGRELTVTGVPIVVPYELIPNRLVVGVGIPYLDKDLVVTTGSGRRRLGDEGFGDLAVFSKLQLYQHDRPGGTTRLTVYGRLKLPTGEDAATDETGRPLPRPLQLGTGSVDVTGGVILTRLRRRWGVNADLLYTETSEGEGYEFGDTLRYDVALAYRLRPRIYRRYPSPQLNLFLELNGETLDRDRAAGTEIPDTGGTTILVSPGIQYMLGRTLLVEASVQLPLIHNLNGNALEVDRTITMGFRWLIF